MVSVKGGRDAPDAALSVAQFFLLLRRIFVQAIWWVGDHGVETVRFLVLYPVEAVGMDHRGFAVMKRGVPSLSVIELPSETFGVAHPKAVDAAPVPNEQVRRIQS